MIDFEKHSENEISFLTYVGGRLGEIRRVSRISQSKIAQYLNTTVSSIHDMEYGYRWISAWDLRAYADLCKADIGSIYEGVSDSLTHSLNPDFARLNPQNREIVNSLISMLVKSEEEN